MFPTDEILQAFGVLGKPVRLTGGEGNSFLVGNLVFKLVISEEETAWRCNLLSNIKCDGFRVAEPVKTKTGQWTYKSWEAAHFIEGKESKNRWREKIGVSRKFHAAIQHIPKPSLIEAATHPWAVADRMVWGDQEMKYGQRLNKVMNRLERLVNPISLTKQLIHGDMTGNILFHESLDPGIIDLSPYWRPAEFATAVIVVDSIVWDGADKSLLAEIDNSRVMNQLLVRAAMWRIKTTEEYIRQYAKGSVDDVDAYKPFIEMLEKRVLE